MLLKTHLAFAALFIILFIQHVNSPLIFAGMVILATIIPDLDSGFTNFGRHLIFRPLQFFVKHRGIIHSLTMAILLSFLIAVFFPVASLGFFVGYSIHIVSDSFTKEGIQPFWPFRARSYGFISTGGRIEETLFFSFIFVDIAVFILVFLI